MVAYNPKTNFPPFAKPTMDNHGEMINYSSFFGSTLGLVTFFTLPRCLYGGSCVEEKCVSVPRNG